MAQNLPNRSVLPEPTSIFWVWTFYLTFWFIYLTNVFIINPKLNV